MTEKPLFPDWPLADGRSIAIATALGLGLLCCAVLLELRRRRREHRLRMEAEWRAVRDLCHEREVLDEDRALVLAILSQFAAEHPYKAVTRRHEFDTCMERYFHTLNATADADTVARRGAQLRDVRVRLGLDYVPIGQRIHSTRELYTGQTMWASRASDAPPKWFQVRTTSVDEALFHLAPVKADTVPSFAEGERIKIRLLREEDARYHFDASVLHATANPIGWRMGHVETLTRNQARAHFRVRFEQTVLVGILNAPVNDDHAGLESRSEVTQMHGRITSLSGGGLAVVFQQLVPKQVLLRVPFTLPGTEQRIVAFVRPAGAQPVGGGSLVRGRFVAMDDDTRDSIIRYIFLKQKQNTLDEKSPH